MWVFEQISGWLWADGRKFAQGYSGKGPGKNNPSKQDIHDLGPIPQGIYVIETPHDTLDHGPYVMALHPHPDQVMFKRGGFLMHGDSMEHPGTASLGCVVLPRWARERVWESGDHLLKVVAQVEEEIAVDPEFD